ncbi:hypothetical protein BTS2_1700 [Bacillus sp. TS-2]|nr:hypothetical protein BTS2_1700 [Bacillus sp. TS-2]
MIILKDAIKKGMALGFGLAAASKEQAEKMVDELVKKGEMTRQESKQFINEMIEKGTERQEKVDDMIAERVRKMMQDLNLVSMDDYKKLEQRITVLEYELKALKEDRAKKEIE